MFTISEFSAVAAMVGVLYLLIFLAYLASGVNKRAISFVAIVAVGPSLVGLIYAAFAKDSVAYLIVFTILTMLASAKLLEYKFVGSLLFDMGVNYRLFKDTTLVSALLSQLVVISVWGVPVIGQRGEGYVCLLLSGFVLSLTLAFEEKVVRSNRYLYLGLFAFGAFAAQLLSIFGLLSVLSWYLDYVLALSLVVALGFVEVLMFTGLLKGSELSFLFKRIVRLVSPKYGAILGVVYFVSMFMAYVYFLMVAVNNVK